MKNYTTKEAADKLGYASDAVIRVAIKNKKLNPKKFGGIWMISEKELETFKNSRRQYNKKK